MYRILIETATPNIRIHAEHADEDFTIRLAEFGPGYQWLNDDPVAIEIMEGLTVGLDFIKNRVKDALL